MTKKLPLDSPRRHMTKAERKAAISMYLHAGESRARIAEAFKRDIRTIDRLLARSEALRWQQK